MALFLGVPHTFRLPRRKYALRPWAYFAARVAGCFSWTISSMVLWFCCCSPQWGAADTEIKVPSVENTELKRSPFTAWSRSVYSHTCYAYCQGFLSCLFLHVRSIHLHFSKTSPDFSLCWLWLTHGSCVGPQNKIGHPAGCRFPYWVPAEYKKAKKNNKKTWLWYDDLWND